MQIERYCLGQETDRITFRLLIWISVRRPRSGMKCSSCGREDLEMIEGFEGSIIWMIPYVYPIRAEDLSCSPPHQSQSSPQTDEGYMDRPIQWELLHQAWPQCWQHLLWWLSVKPQNTIPYSPELEIKKIAAFVYQSIILFQKSWDACRPVALAVSALLDAMKTDPFLKRLSWHNQKRSAESGGRYARHCWVTALPIWTSPIEAVLQV